MNIRPGLNHPAARYNTRTESPVYTYTFENHGRADGGILDRIENIEGDAGDDSHQHHVVVPSYTARDPKPLFVGVPEGYGVRVYADSLDTLVTELYRIGEGRPIMTSGTKPDQFLVVAHPDLDNDDLRGWYEGAFA